jgi:pimeloyl-ACP methyl ester carboxylesterase
MQTFQSGGVEIAYLDVGAAEHGPPRETVLLIHGFASNASVNWVSTGWVATLVDAGYRVLAIDNRGHGGSAKLRDPSQHGAPIMAEDARRLLDHLGLARAHVIGYSMGARIAAFLMLRHPERVGRVVLGGLGINMVRGLGRGDAIAEALEADSLEAVTHPAGRVFRAFAEQTKSDLMALAACMRSAREPITVEALRSVRCPVLVVVGTMDDVAGSGAELAAIIPGAHNLDLAGRDHMKAVGDRGFKSGAIAFLTGASPPAENVRA